MRSSKDPRGSAAGGPEPVGLPAGAPCGGAAMAGVAGTAGPTGVARTGVGWNVAAPPEKALRDATDNMPGMIGQ